MNERQPPGRRLAPTGPRPGTGRRRRLRAGAFGGALLALALATGCGSSARTLPPGGIALVGDRVILRSELATLMNETRGEYREQGTPFPRRGSRAYRALQDQALTSLVEASELDQRAVEMKLRITRPQVDGQLRDLLRHSFDGDSDKLRAEMAARGLTRADLRKRARQFLVESAIRARLTRGATVSVAEIRGYYRAHRARYASTEVETRRVRSILVASRPLAARLSRQLRYGASFQGLARRYSRTWRGPGDAGVLTIARGTAPAAFERAAFSLRSGEVSAPVPTAVGWYVVEALGPVGHTGGVSLASVRGSIRSELLDAKQAKLLRDWLATTKAAFCARGIVYRSGYKPLRDPCSLDSAPMTLTS